MAQDEDYDIMPHKEIIRIKKELEELKNAKETTETKNIVIQIHTLKNSINDLIAVFKEAEEAFKLEEKEPSYIKDLLNKLNILSEQNTRIAEGIVAVADMIKEVKLKMDKQIIERPRPRPEPEPFGAPPRSQPQFGLPPAQMPPPRAEFPSPPDFDIPPPPDFGEKPKKGLFGRIKR